MDKSDERQPSEAQGDNTTVTSEQGLEQGVDQSRRRLSRAALASGAVVFSLGNRPAWGTGSYVAGCMSVMTANSFNPDTGHFVSAPAGRPDHNEDLARKIHHIGDAPDYLGRSHSGRWSVCEDTRRSDTVCLVKGRCRDDNWGAPPLERPALLTAQLRISPHSDAQS